MASAARSPQRRLAAAGLAGLLLLLAALYVLGAQEHSRRVNTDASTFDQSAYLHYAGQMRDTSYAYVGGRNRMPLYPFLQSLALKTGQDDAAIFARAKRFNIAISVALLALLYPLMRRALPPLSTIILVLIAAFMVFIFKAAYVQCELVYYFLSFCAFLSMLAILETPTWPRGVLAGGLLGLAQLTKASALAAVACFVVVAGGWFLIQTMRTFRAGRAGTPLAGLAAVGLTVLTFFAVIYPYIQTSKRIFGRYFYNVNSTFYLWYDTHEQVTTGTRLHGDREGWPRLPPDQIPGPAKYFREHDAGQVLERLRSGMVELHVRARKSYGYYKYLLLFAGFALAMALSRPRVWLGVSPVRWVQILFCLCLFGGYLLLFAWSAATLWGLNRVALQIFLPMMFCLALAMEAQARTTGAFALRIFQAGILCVLIPDIYLVLTSRLLTMAGGH